MLRYLQPVINARVVQMIKSMIQIVILMVFAQGEKINTVGVHVTTASLEFIVNWKKSVQGEIVCACLVCRNCPSCEIVYTCLLCNGLISHHSTRIISEPDTSVTSLNTTENIWAIMYDENCKPLKEYGRPVYALEKAVKEDGSIINDKVALIYSGSRWLGTVKAGAANLTTEEVRILREDYHAFWNEAYKYDTVTVSDPTMGSSPVGVDFFLIGERGPSYGPLGVLYPLQQPPGKGLFRCLDDNGSKAMAIMTKDSTTTATKQVVTNNMNQCANVTGGRFMGNQEVSLNVAQTLDPP